MKNDQARTLRRLTGCCAVLWFVWMCGPTDAFAQCEPIDAPTFDANLATADGALSEGRLRVAAEILKTTANALPCMTEVASTDTLARFGRQMAQIAFMSQDEPATTRWAVFANRANKNLKWSDDFEEDHPFRAAVTEAETPIIGRPEGKTLAPPRGGAVFADGHLLVEAALEAETPHLIQLVDSSRKVVKAFWMDGANFPAGLLVDGTEPARLPGWYKGPTPKTTNGAVVKRQFPAKVIPAAIGGGLLVVSGALYGVALATKGQLNEQIEDPKDLKQIRSTANGLVFSSAAVAAAAIGVGVTGVILVDGGGVGFNVRF